MFPAEDESTPILPFVVGFIILLLLAGGIWFLFFAQPPIPPPPECEEDWECSGWSACVNGIQTRVCIDQNACGTIDDKPPVQQSCVSPPVCGNQICEAGENSTNCPADCGTIPPFCGDNACQSSEDCFTCPQDCGTCQPFCGDSVCDATETCSTCESDCGVCECTENWFCTDWGPCTNGTQTRSCTDLNACGTQVDQPLLSQTCGIDLKIIRDQFGVPHVFATTDYSAFYGMGYATAQDRIYQMHRTRMIMKGRLSELNGSMGGGATINLDIKMRRLQFADYAAARYPNLDAETKDFLQAYSDGVNYYLETHKTSLLYLFDSVPEPWTPVDSLLVWDSVVRAGVDATEVTNRRTFDQKVAQLGSADAAAADMEPTAYVDSDGAVVQQSDVPAATLQAMQTYANQHSPFGGYSTNLIEVPKMSHAWVVGGSRSTTGAAILVSSPQLDVTSPSPWHEIHVKGATFDVRGAAIPGAPGIYVGFNPRVAWGITAAGGDLSDVFKLKMVGTDQYEYNGQTYTIESRNETILVKNGNPQSITVKKTILGPIITPMVSALPGEEYIVQAVPLVDSDIHTIQSLIAMMRADDVYQFRDALAKYRSPAVHIIFGDSQGNIGYWHLAAVPTRSSLSPLAGMVAQDGSHSQYLWQGFIPHTLRPHVINPSSGILFSANNLSAGAWYPIFYNPGWGGGGDTARSYRLRELLLETHPAKFTPSEVLDIHFDDVSIFRRDLVEIARYVRDNQGEDKFSSTAINALNLLEEWYEDGAHSSINEPYFALVSNFRSRLRASDSLGITNVYGEGEPGMRAWIRHAKLVMANNQNFRPFEITLLENKLSTAWSLTTSQFGNDPAQWSSQYVSQGASHRVQYFNTVFFGFGSLDPSKDRTYTGWTNPDIGTLGSQLTQSYSLFVDLSRPDDARTLLPLGNSENPGNVHFNDLASRWTSENFYSAPLTQSRLQNITESTVTLNYIR